jgi:hypothetical protein
VRRMGTSPVLLIVLAGAGAQFDGIAGIGDRPRPFQVVMLAAAVAAVVAHSVLTWLDDREAVAKLCPDASDTELDLKKISTRTPVVSSNRRLPHAFMPVPDCRQAA